MLQNTRPNHSPQKAFRFAMLCLTIGWSAATCAPSNNESTADTGSDSNGPVAVDPCGFAETPAGTIDVSERYDIFHDTVYSRISALLRERPVPSYHYVFKEEGDCRYLKVKYGSCDPACAPEAVCTADNQCVTNPKAVAGGLMTIEGLENPITIQAEDYSLGTYNGPAGLPAELFGADEPVGAVLAGDVYPALSMAAKGVAVLDHDLTDNGFEMVDGADAELTWMPGPNPNACIQVMLYSYNEAHGAPLPDIIWCEGTDTGSLIIPRSFVEEFPSGQTPEVTSGYDWPHSELTRYTQNTKTVPQGLVRLTVRSTTYFLLSHPEPSPDTSFESDHLESSGTE